MYNFSKCSHTRDAYGNALVALGEKEPRLVVLDSDLSGSTKTDKFAKKFPERFIDIGIAEQNLIDIAAGLSLSGKIPFVSTFAIFGCGRAWEQIRNTLALDNLTVNLVMTHAGLSLGGDGATHQSLEDIAIMRVIPNMQVIVPADSVETEEVIRYAAENKGPKYIRLSRQSTLDVFRRGEYQFDPSQYPVIEEGSDVTIFTNGCMIRESLKACYALKKEGISIKVINLHTIKPISKKIVIDEAKKSGGIVTVEEHNVIGGLGSAVAEILSQYRPVPMRIIGVNDRFGGSGKVEELYRELDLTPEHIIKAVHEVMKLR
ncbi:transketolase family protein [Methanoregula sp.]|jgi:transketolase|uniref:transketolase family protein n=1 Tax=Methanoregula sp. TaxID=2052170 RepID=UPI003562E5E3